MMFEIHKFSKDGLFLGVVSGMGRNKGTWDAAAYSLRTAQRWLMQCRKDDPSCAYKIEQV